MISSRYFTYDSAQFFPDGEFYEDQASKYMTYYVVFITHIACGLGTMILGPFLIFGRFRNRFLGLHRALGKVYILAVLLGATVSFYFSLHVYGGVSPMLAGWVKSISWATA